MNAAGQGEGKEALGGSDQQGDGLTGVAVNKFWFRVVRGLLVQFFDGWHFTTRFRQLDPIPDQDRAVIDFRHEGGRQGGQEEVTPKGGEGIHENRFAVEEIEEPVIEDLLQTQGSDEAGHASQIGSNGEADQTESKPEEGCFPREGGAQPPDHLPPRNPEGHRRFSFLGKGGSCYYSIYML